MKKIWIIMLITFFGGYSSQVLGQESPLRNSFLKELYTCGVATVENDNVKVAIPFDVHGTDCGAPDCYTTEVRFAFPLRKEVVSVSYTHLTLPTIYSV